MTTRPGSHPLHPLPAGVPGRRPGTHVWVAGATGLVVMAFVTAAFTAVVLIGDVGRPGTDGFRASSSDEATSLSTLRVECEQGSLTSCDELYFQSPGGSEDERFGSTCGDRGEELFGTCEDGAGAEEDDSGAGDFGSDTDTDDFRAACAGGDMTACDDLYLGSPAGSDDETFGSECGGRADESAGFCEGAVTDPGALDELHGECEAGDLASCDQLYNDTLAGSDYEEFGSTCGDRREPTDGDCDSY